MNDELKTAEGINEPMVGIALSYKRWDNELNRDRCGSCARVLISGQQTCVCGAKFVGRLRVLQ